MNVQLIQIQLKCSVVLTQPLESVSLPMSSTFNNYLELLRKTWIARENLTKMAAVIKVFTRMTHQRRRYLNAMEDK